MSREDELRVEYERLVGEGMPIAMKEPLRAIPLLERSYELALELGMREEAGGILAMLSRGALRAGHVQAIRFARKLAREFPDDEGALWTVGQVCSQLAENFARRGKYVRAARLANAGGAAHRRRRSFCAAEQAELCEYLAKQCERRAVELLASGQAEHSVQKNG
jgi:hypothetical protein